MKILMVTMALGIGGAETHIVELSRALCRAGHDVTVASAGGVFASELEACGIRHVTLPLADKRPASVTESYRGLKKLISEGNFDVVHGHARIPNFILSLVRRSVDFRFVTTAHLDFAVNALWRRISDWGERTLAVSDDIKEYLVREYGTPADNIDITINGIDMEKFSPDTDYSGVMSEFGLDSAHRRAVYISRIDHDRSAPAFMLCEAAPGLARRYGDLDIVIVGAGDDFERLTAAAEEANKAAGRRIVTLCGARSDINRFCAMADVFIGVSRSALEAMACGAPVIVAGNQGYLGIFGEEKLETARLTNFCCRGCEMPSAELISRDLCALLDADSDELRKIGDYGRETVRQYYSADRMAKDYLGCYAKLGPSASHRRSDVLFCGYYGYGNIGDEASLECIVGAIFAECPSVRMTVLSANPDTFGKKLGIRAFSRMSPFTVLREISRTNVLVFGGGTLLQDRTSMRSLRYYAWILRAAARRGKKIYVYANGVGPLIKSGSRKAVRRALAGADYISVRENSSADALTAAGVSPDKIHISADPVFLMEKPDGAEIAAVREKVGISGEYFAVSLRDFAGRVGDFDGRGEDFDGRISRAVRDIAAEHGLTPVFAVMQDGEDRELNTQICAMSGDGALTAPVLSAREMTALFAGARFTLGMRLHSVILSAAVGTGAVALSYDPKVDALCEYLGFDAPADARSFTAEQLVSAARVLCTDGAKADGEANGDTGCADVCERIKMLREKALGDVHTVLEMTGRA